MLYVFLSQKDAALSDDYGKDLASVQALQRKHEGFEVCICCVPTCSYIMHAIIVKESPIRNVLYGKWLEVIRINQVPQLLLSNSHPPLTPACSDWSPKATFAIYFFILNSCSVI